MITESQCDYSFCSDIEYKSYSVPVIEYPSIDLYDPRKSDGKLDMWYFNGQLERFMKSQHFYHDLEGGQWYRWNQRLDGVYNAIDESVVMAFIRSFVKHFEITPKRSFILDVYEQMKYDLNSVPRMEDKPEVTEGGEVIIRSGAELLEPYTCPADCPEYDKLMHANVLFAFNNGLFNWVTGELLPFTPSVFITDKSRIYCDWNPKANPSEAISVYRGLFNDNQSLNTLFDMMAYCLYRTPYSEVNPYIWFLYGDAGTGKSAVYHVIETMLRSNAGTTQAEILCARFGQASLIGKRVNLANEVSRGLLDAQWMKAYADGCGVDGTVTVEMKYKDPRAVNINTTLLFASNNQVSFGSDSGIARRLRVIPMMIKQDEDARIWDTLTSPEALSWLAWVLFERWILIQQRHGAIEEAREIVKASNEMMRAGSSVREFFFEQYDLEEKEDVADYIVNDSVLSVKSSLYNAFQEYCQRTGRNPISRAEFNLQIQTEYGLKDSRKRLGYGVNAIHMWAKR